MRQISILPAGCQISSKNVLFCNDNKIVCASTLAIYVFNAKTFILEKVISASERTITAICVSPHDNNLLAIAAVGGDISLWKMEEENLASRFTLQANAHTLLEWDPHSPDHCAIVLNHPNVRVLYWDVKRPLSNLTEIFAIKNDTLNLADVFSSTKNESLKVVAARWNTHVPGLMAIGCSNSWVILLNTKAKTQKMLQVKERIAPVVDMQWDRLSSVYLLVAYQMFVSLWDTETLTEVHAFDKQPGGITSIAWMDWTAGNFISSNAKTGILRVWNASQRQPIDTVRVASSGINTVYFGAGTKRALCACVDGTIVVYHMVKMQVEFSSSAGHTETIFDCSLSPASADTLATASYDNSIKLWNINDFSLNKTLHGSESIVYSVDWSPRGKLVVGSTANGAVYLWDVESGRQLAKYLHHAKSSYSVAWNRMHEELICSSSADMTVVVFQVEFDELFSPTNVITGSGPRKGSKSGGNLPTATAGSAAAGITPSTIKMRFTHPAPVFGCAWSVHYGSILSTCCQDGNVRIFDHTASGSSVLKCILVGHSARSFNAAWSSLIKGTLASGSDDKNVIVWEIDLDAIKDKTVAPLPGEVPSVANISPTHVLTGHKANVRAITWSYEHKSLLLSGAWDSTIRLWDARNAICLQVVNDHSADVYALSSHPDRPFTYVSCSRDTTVRVWEIGGVVTKMRLLAAWECGLDSLVDNEVNVAKAGEADTINGLDYIRSLGPATDTSSNALLSSLMPILSGRKSALLSNELRKVPGGISPNGAFLSGVNDSKGSDAKGEDKDSGNSSSSPFPLTARGKSNAALAARRYNPPRTVAERTALAQKYYKIYSLFSGANGSIDVWDGVLALLSDMAEQQQQQLLQQRKEEEEAGSGGGGDGGGVAAAKRETLTTAARSDSSKFVPRPITQRLVLHESEVLPRARSDARKSESARMGTRRGDFTGKVEDQLRQAALQHAKVGDFSKYCTIMVDLGEWTSALAVAPSVSMEYWQSLAFKYSQHLAGLSSEQAVPYMLGTGHDADAVEFYLRRRDVSSALIIAKMSETRTDLIPIQQVSLGDGSAKTSTPGMSSGIPPSGGGGGSDKSIIAGIALDVNDDNGGGAGDGATAAADSSDITCGTSQHGVGSVGGGGGGGGGISRKISSGRSNARTRTETEKIYSRSIVSAVNTQSALTQLGAGKPILAAAQHLAVGNVEAAVETLSTCGEEDLAYAIALCLGLDSDAHLIDLADHVATLQSLPAALDMLDSLSNTAIIEEEQALLISRYCDHSKDAKVVAECKGLKPQQHWVNKASEEEEIGSDTEAVVAYVLARKFTQAATLAINYLRKHVREPQEMNMNAKRMLRVLKYLRAIELATPLKGTFLCFMLWFGAHEAADLGLWSTGSCMLNILAYQCTDNSFPVRPQEILYQELIFRVYDGDGRALVRIDDLIGSACRDTTQAPPPEVVETLKTIRSLLLDTTTYSSYSSSSSSSSSIGFSGVSVSTCGASSSSWAERLMTLRGEKNGGGVWGTNTTAVFRELQRMSEALSLPSLSPKRKVSSNISPKSMSAKLNIHPRSGIPKLPSSEKLSSGNDSSSDSNSYSNSGGGSNSYNGYRSGVTGAIATASAVHVVAQGSLLPACNPQLRELHSIISGQPIRGAAITLDGDKRGTAIAGVNEAMAWRKIMPFSPDMTGAIMHVR